MPEIIFHSDLIKTENIDVAELSREALFVTPVDYDFSSENWNEGSGSGWDSEEAAECETCHGVYVGGFSATCDNPDCERYGEEIAEDLGPMMNYYYPLESAPDWEGIRQLVDLPLCAVTIDGERHALALTGGGMDLSWEICEGFMRLGMLPPLHFAGLPGMAGRGLSARDKAIVAGCVESAKKASEIMENRADYARQSAENCVKSEAQRRRASIMRQIEEGWPVGVFDDLKEGTPIETVAERARKTLDDAENEELQPLLGELGELSPSGRAVEPDPETQDYEIRLNLVYPARNEEEAAELAEVGEDAADRHAGRAINALLAERGVEGGSVTVSSEGEPESIV